MVCVYICGYVCGVWYVWYVVRVYVFVVCVVCVYVCDVWYVFVLYICMCGV